MSKKLNEIQWIRDKNGSISWNSDNTENTKELLNSTGTGFCLAKFTQVTMHLGTGMTHSCHHPSPHKIPLNELENNPAALFNTNVLKIARAEMIAGKKPAECDYCWRVEDNGNTSDRTFKSMEPWALTEHDQIVDTNPSNNFKPTYLEVSFSNACNFKCIYCGPEFSSKWVEDLKQHGPIKLLDGTTSGQWAQGWQKLDELSYKNSEFNPYVDAFWKWWPDIYANLKHYRITGGEPLLSKETFRSIDWFIDNPNPELEFSINTNLGVPDKLWDKFIERVYVLINTRSIKKLTIYTSADGFGKRASYSRIGMDFNVFSKRYEQLLALGNVRAVIMCTYNILSITSFKELLEWQLKLKRQYNSCAVALRWEGETGFSLGDNESYTERSSNRYTNEFCVGLDIPYLRSPKFLDAAISTDDLVDDYLIPSINYMSEHIVNNNWINHSGFEKHEFEKFKRIVLDRIYSRKKGTVPDHAVTVNRAKFYEFISEIDKRNGSTFLDVYPEMEHFYNVCKDAAATITASI